MTKEQKSLRILEIKAQAFDEIDDLRLTIDSHRNFYHRVSNTIREARYAVSEVERLRDGPSEFIKCQHWSCSQPATSQIHDSDGETTMLCEQHASQALANGCKLVIAEDRFVEPPDV